MFSPLLQSNNDTLQRHNSVLQYYCIIRSDLYNCYRWVSQKGIRKLWKPLTSIRENVAFLCLSPLFQLVYFNSFFLFPLKSELNLSSSLHFNNINWRKNKRIFSIHMLIHIEFIHILTVSKLNQVTWLFFQYFVDNMLNSSYRNIVICK